ncbi:MAG: putative 7-carboxy-7-deazaguanine synthase QueE [Solirubrobacterales bacterium]
MEYNIIEKFISIDGEGPTAGETAVFIRFGGCNLCCSWCDTAYSIDKNVKGNMLTKEEIYKFIKESGINNVTITGGEPLIQSGIEELIYYLSGDENLLIHVETNGSVPFYKLEKVWQLPNVSFVLDYKLPDSKMEKFMDLKNYEYIQSKDVCKFVIASEDDLNKALVIIKRYNLPEKCMVYLSPVTDKIDPAFIVEYMKNNKLNKVKLQLQLHKIIWSPETREV